MQWTLDLTRLWARLGVREQHQPDLVNAIQPVALIGDFSALVPPVLPAMAWAGCQFTPGAGLHSGFEVFSRAPGGIFIREFSASSAVTQTFRWEIGFASRALASVAPLQQMGPVAATSIVTFGPVAAPGVLTLNHPHRSSGIGNAMFLGSESLVYIPPGQFFYVESSAAVTSTVQLAVNFTEVPESIAANPT